MARNRILFGALGCSLLFFLAAPPLMGQQIQFVDVTSKAGIDFKHTFGDFKLSNILETTGSGAAFLDYNNDGYLDIYVVNCCYLEGINDPEGSKIGEVTNRLYRNNGDGTFTDVTQEAGVGDTGYGMGVAVGDYNNDGHPDIYVTNYGPNVLYRNNGDGTFTDVTQEAGVAGPDTLNGFPKWSTNAVFFDYDKDGYLDLFVGNYLAFDPEYRFYYGPEGFPGPQAYLGQPDILYHNNGDGTFTDVTEKAGIVAEVDGKAMGASCGDYNNDGYPDIFIANDAMENFLYRNNGDGTFTNVALSAWVAYGDGGESTASMHGCFSDFNNDGYLDIFVPDMTFNALFCNKGDGTFQDVIVMTGIPSVAGQFVGWGGFIFDYDNDGKRDIFVANGGAHHLYGHQDLLFRNNGDGTFTDVSLESGQYFHTKRTGRGAAYGDYDNDGDLDIFIVNIDLKGTPVLLRNDGGNKNNWLTIKTIGTKSNRDGIGARIKVVAGDMVQIDEVKSASSYLSQADLRVHFGLGRHTKVDLVEIKWPSGVVQTLKNVRVNQILTVKEKK